MQELYIVDEEFEQYKEVILEINEEIEQKLSKIISALHKAETAVSYGTFHRNLGAYVEKLCVMQGQLGYLTSQMKLDATSYVQMIELLDVFF